MRLKNYFTVPTGQKITERQLRRVLVSSICSILLCMSCLVGTTWAWFAVSIENTGNVIEIAKVTANVSIKNDEGAEITKSDDGSYSLNGNDTYIVSIQLDNNATASDDFNDPRNPVYVLMSIAQNGEPQYYYFTFQGDKTEATQEISLGNNPAVITFSVSWIKPASESATPIGDEVLAIGETSTEQNGTGTTEPSTEAEAESSEIKSDEETTGATETSTEKETSGTTVTTGTTESSTTTETSGESTATTAATEKPTDNETPTTTAATGTTESSTATETTGETTETTAATEQPTEKKTSATTESTDTAE